MYCIHRLVTAAIVASLIPFSLTSAVTIGQLDDFEDATTQGWMVGLANSPTPPTNVADGGPLGTGDNFLQLTSIGGSGPGSRLAVINAAQWSGNYLTAGITSIELDVRNLGSTDLSLRLYLENPQGGPPTDAAISDAVVIPAGGAWTPIAFSIDSLSLTTLSGDVNVLLANVTALRIFHSSSPTHPGPPVVANLGVDNLRAVPEPATLPLLGVGLTGIASLRRTRARLRKVSRRARENRRQGELFHK